VRLTKAEFFWINSPFFWFFQRCIEIPLFKSLGLNLEGARVLEIGCGAGYGAGIFSRMGVRSYTGVDIMEEQIRWARQRNPPPCEFLVMDAADLSHFKDGSQDVVLDCRILHHVARWRKALTESARVLRPGGMFFACEPHPYFSRFSDAVLGSRHPEEAFFKAADFIGELKTLGFEVKARRGITIFVAGATRG
jgi:ubiquinone/menaquinone biosynthesis C-methylase UbiE